MLVGTWNEQETAAQVNLLNGNAREDLRKNYTTIPNQL
jgi:hypothetical protein